MSEPSREKDSVCAACGGSIAPGVPFGMCSRCLVESALGDGGHDEDLDVLDDGRIGGGEPLGEIGPYHLVEKVGEGAFGEVFAARQARPVRRTVALKLLKRGMDSRQITARFEAERQTLALMKHPNVATVFDGGESPDGRPFFVLEFVDGPPITEFCEQAGLGLRARLELFRAVCDGVHHAHQKGVIHRDLKPQNVLVDRRGEPGTPKVIDFGIAKVTEQVVTARTVFTEAGRPIGTPAYMSPEQATGTGADVDVRSDVYSLGALLYHLVAGAPPFDEQRLRHAGAAGMERILTEEEPRRPSACPGGPTSSSDLDWIVMKALAKDRADRYDSAAALREDIGRFLRGDAVAARPPSAIYRARKFVRRHRVGLAATAAVFAALVGGVVAATLQARRAIRAEREAAERAVVSNALFDYINDDVVAAALEHGPMGMLRLGTILDRAEDKIEGRLGDHPLVEAGARLLLARAYHGIGRQQDSERNARRSLALYRDHVPEPDRRSLGAAAILGQALLARGQAAAALAEAERAFASGSALPRSPGLDAPRATLLEVRDAALRKLGRGAAERLVVQRNLVDYRIGDRDAWGRFMASHVELGEQALASGELAAAAVQCRRATIIASFMNGSGMWVGAPRMSVLDLRRRILAAGGSREILVDSFEKSALRWDVGEVVGGLDLPERPRLAVEGYVRSRRGEAKAAADLWTRAVALHGDGAPHPLLHGQSLRLEAEGRNAEAASAVRAALEGILPAVANEDIEISMWYAATWQRTRSAAGLEIDAVRLPLSQEFVFAGNGHRFRRIEIPLPWSEAKAVCERLGGHLATVASEAENQFLHETFAADRLCWLGGSDAEEEGTWRWVDGAPWGEAPWAPGQPSADEEDEDYLGIGGFDFRLHDIRYGFGSRWFDHEGDGIPTNSHRADPLKAIVVTYAICEWDDDPG